MTEVKSPTTEIGFRIKLFFRIRKKKQKEKEKRQRAECSIRVKGSDLFAECANEDLYAAVDGLVDKIDRQVVRHKDRLQDHHFDARRREQA